MTRWIALLMLCSVQVLAQPTQKLPNIGKIIAQSDEFNAVPAMRNGCVLRMCAGEKLCCVTSFQLTLSRGDTTSVSDSSVRSTSIIRCGCETPTGDSLPGCNTGGSWLAWVRVKSVEAGAYVLDHAYAVGNETITCTIE